MISDSKNLGIRSRGVPPLKRHLARCNSLFTQSSARATCFSGSGLLQLQEYRPSKPRVREHFDIPTVSPVPRGIN
jgi:hypothetical protein